VHSTACVCHAVCAPALRNFSLNAVHPQVAKLRALISESAASAVKRRHVHEAQASMPPHHVNRGLKGKLEEMHMEELDVVRLHSRLEELDVRQPFQPHLDFSPRETDCISCISFPPYLN
jgi:hypothetical protein